MAITYDAPSNTITLDGNFLNYHFDDLQAADTAAGWGVIQTLGNSYWVNCKIVVGDGTNKTYLTDAEKNIFFTVASGTQLHVRPNSELTLGHPDGDYGKGGCSLTALGMTGTYSFGYTSGAAGDLRLYGCSINIPCRWGWFNGTSQIVDIRNSVVRGWGLLGGTSSIIRAVFNYDVSNYYGGFGFANTFAVMEDYTCIGGGGASFFAFSYDATIRNMKTPNQATKWIDCYGTNKTLNAVDCESSVWGANYTGGASHTVVNRQYSYNVFVLDETGIPIKDARVRLTDINDTEIFNTTTNVSGQLLIGTQEVTHSQYISQAIQTKTPHTVTVSKQAYKQYKETFTLDHKMDKTYITLKLQTPQTDQGGI